MASDLEKAQLMSILARGKGNWGGKYDRMEHFKKFQNLKDIIKELSKIGWVIVHNKPSYTGISLNNEYKQEIVYFIEMNLPELKGIIK
ncbi:hypothetical protein J4205_02860 [Candidatus Pacearchaeota archaeon]|nr:hypothetical protein [Candidatus Pacearchaeota archaeon]